MRKQRVRIGKEGESMAFGYLKRNGYILIEKNYRCPLGEMDLVAFHKEILVFVEIKTLRGLYFGQPRISVNRKKQIKLAQIAQYYLKQKRLQGRSARLYVVEVHKEDGDWKISVIQNAFDLPYP